MALVEGRSVGELLLDSDLIVRDVLMDFASLDGRAMVRTWGEVVEAAGDLWRALPAFDEGTREPRRPDVGGVLMQQLETMNTNLLKAGRRHRWPGTGPADERLLQVCENLTAAAAILTRHRTDIRPMRLAVQSDLEAAKARLMHVLYIGAHGVQVALNRDLRDLTAMSPHRRAALPAETTQRTIEARDRMAAFEQLAGAYVSATFPVTLRGEHQLRPEPDRLRQAWATWDVQAHRALNAAGARPPATSTDPATDTTTVRPMAGTLSLIAQTQAHAAYGSQRILLAAATTGSIDRQQYRYRLAPVLEELQASWSGLAADWSRLAPRVRSLDPGLVNAANEARAATREIVHQGSTVSEPEKIAARLNLTHACRTVQLALATSTDLAFAVREATTDPHLRASARGLNTLAMALEARGPSGNASPRAWVRLTDHMQDRHVDLPELVRGALLQAAQTTAQVSSTAAGAAAFVGAPSDEPASAIAGVSGSFRARELRCTPPPSRSRPVAR